MKNLTGTTYHRQYQARMRSQIPSRAKAIPHWQARIAQIKAPGVRSYSEPRFYKKALSTAERCLRCAKQDLAFAKGVVSGKLKPYLNDYNFIEWK